MSSRGLKIALSELQLGLRYESDDATRNLSDDLRAALGTSITVGEIGGARAILEVILNALPD